MYLLYETADKRKMKKFIRNLENKSFVVADYQDVRHIALEEGDRIMNIFTYNNRLLVQDVPMRARANNLEELFSFRASVEVDSNKVVNRDLFAEHLKDLFLMN